MCNATLNATVHKFEAAGLGKAPFRFVGLETAADRGAVQNERKGDGLIYTTNNATSCDYCGQGIMNAFVVASADGRRFKVGCDCIRKVGDKGLMKIVSDAEAAKRRAKAADRRKAKWQREADLLAKFNRGECEALRGLPHPKGREGATAYDYVNWCVTNRCVGALVLDLIKGA